MAEGRAGHPIRRRRGEASHDVVVEASDLLVARRRHRVAGVPTRVVHGAPRSFDGPLRWTAWSPLDLGFVMMLASIVVLNAADVVVTIAHVLDVGWAAEANPIARVAGTTAGPGALVVLKGFALALSIPVMWHVYRLGALALLGARAPHERVAAHRTRAVMVGSTVMLTLFYTWVIQNNLRIVGVFRTALGFFGF